MKPHPALRTLTVQPQLWDSPNAPHKGSTIKPEYAEWIKTNVPTNCAGLCGVYADKMAGAFPELTSVWGTYVCPVWGEQAHWFCLTPTKEIIDPTASQFPSKGAGQYKPFELFTAGEKDWMMRGKQSTWAKISPSDAAFAAIGDRLQSRIRRSFLSTANKGPCVLCGKERCEHRYFPDRDGAECWQWADNNLDFDTLQRKWRESYHVIKAANRHRLKYEDTENWLRWVLTFPHSWQVMALDEVKNALPDQTYWRLAGNIFWKSRNHAVFHDLWLSLLRAPRPYAHCFHTPQQQAAWDALPTQVMIFRGHGPKNREGLWWSLGLHLACGISSAHGKNGRVISAIVPKDDVLYLGELKESGYLNHECVCYVKGLGEIQSKLYDEIVAGL